jgi:hypothetical protein
MVYERCDLEMDLERMQDEKISCCIGLHFCLCVRTVGRIRNLPNRNIWYMIYDIWYTVWYIIGHSDIGWLPRWYRVYFFVVCRGYLFCILSRLLEVVNGLSYFKYLFFDIFDVKIVLWSYWVGQYFKMSAIWCQNSFVVILGGSVF